MNELRSLFTFFKDIEPLKDTLRTGIPQQGRTESVAEHSWSLATMAIILCPKYFPQLDFKKVLTMCLIHDLGEIINGDIPAPLQANLPDKNKQEREDFKSVVSSLPDSVSQELLLFWDEYESASSPEARLVKALDKIETIIQHNQGNNAPDFDHDFDLKYGQQYMDFDPVINELRSMVDEETREKIV